MPIDRAAAATDQPPSDPLTQPEPTFGREWSVTVHKASLGRGLPASSTLAQGAINPMTYQQRP